MSHIAKIELQVKDLAALEKACQDIGFIFVANQKSYEWYGRFVGDSPMPEGLNESMLGKCDHAIQVPGAKYEIGVINMGDHYQLHCDQWGPGGLEGKSEKLLQPYAIAATKNVIKKNRYRLFKENKLENGAVELRIRI
jgi:hypothetical protein